MKRVKNFFYQRKKKGNKLLVKICKVPVYVKRCESVELEKSPEWHVINNSPLFDADWYRSRYGLEDVEDLPQHYLEEGGMRGYAASMDFDSLKYLNNFPDIRQARVNPLVHWEGSGKYESSRYKFTVDSMPLITYLPEKFRPRDNAKNVLLVSHMMNHTGAPILLLETGKMLQSAGYNVYVLSREDGDLRRKFLSVGIPVYVCSECLLPTWDASILPIRVDFCLCNTILSWALYNSLSKSIPSIWWVHENMHVDELSEDVKSALKDARSLFVPGKLTASYYSALNQNISFLPYPIVDRYVKSGNGPRKLIRFSVMGSLEPRKAQDVFVDAVNSLPASIAKQAEFEIIGSKIAGAYSVKLEKKLKKFGRVHYCEALTDFNKYYEYVDSVDVVCCPSLEDPFPLTVIDAMMYGKLCLVSDRVGQSQVITHGVDGFVFPVGEVEKLADIIRYVIENKNKLTEYQRASRGLFEREFNYEACKKLLCNLIEEGCVK